MAMRRSLILAAIVGMFGATQLLAEPFSSREALRILPKARGEVTLATYPNRMPQKDLAQLEAAKLKLKDVFAAVGASLAGYGAVAISPDEGLLVDWISGVSEHHSAAAAQKGALDYCNAKKKKSSAACVILVEVAPKRAKASAALTLSESANAALRGPYRKLKKPKAFAISPSSGDFGFETGKAARALAACGAAQNKSGDCKVVIVD